MLKEVLLNIQDIEAFEFEQMFQLMAVHYENVQKDKFRKDFYEKDGVMVVYDEHESIVGFSTYKITETEYRRQTVHILFSGDTVLHKKYWGKTYAYKLAGSIFRMLLEKNISPLYWFLISKGYKTYMYLPLFFKKFYPCCFEDIPSYKKGLLDSIAGYKFNNHYNADRGVVVESADRLIPEYNGIPENKMQNRHVKHFAALNPGFINGEELACIAKIEKSNLTELGKRFILG